MVVVCSLMVIGTSIHEPLAKDRVVARCRKTRPLTPASPRPGQMPAYVGYLEGCTAPVRDKNGHEQNT
jgi:hypothetical protein